jgi:DNA-directed RNA polymerase specialized sigma24 family protein
VKRGRRKTAASSSGHDLGRRYQAAAQRQVSRERPLQEVLDASSAALNRLLAGKGPSPSQSAQRRELGVVLADALAKLSEEHREVIVLRSLQDIRRIARGARAGRRAGPRPPAPEKISRSLSPSAVGIRFQG